MTQFPTVSRADIEAGIARGRQLRSRYLAERAQGLAEALTKALVRHYRGREIGRYLEDLPDYLLKDIGIARTQIPAVAAGSWACGWATSSLRFLASSALRLVTVTA